MALDCFGTQIGDIEQVPNVLGLLGLDIGGIVCFEDPWKG